MEEQHISLRYVGGSSDKVYHLHLVPSGSGWVVNFEYGRYGSTLQSGTKTKAGSVAYDAAKKIYDKILKEKTTEGYKPIGEKSAGQVASAPVEVAEWVPQLLNPVDEVQATALLYDPNWGMQEKFDGVNRIIGVTEKGEPFAVNKLGKPVPVPAALARDLQSLHMLVGRIVIAGEGMGETVQCHDLLWLNSDLRYEAFSVRYQKLDSIFESCCFDTLSLAPLFLGNDKKGAFQRLRKGNFEGVVFKRLSAPYTSGRPASGGDQLKFKFWAEPAAVIVSKINAKSSFGMEMLNDQGERVFVGNCTVPVNKDMPQVGDIVEVKYLYIVAEGGHLYQPFYLGPKDAGQISDCYTRQLKIKRRTP